MIKKPEPSPFWPWQLALVDTIVVIAISIVWGVYR